MSKCQCKWFEIVVVCNKSWSLGLVTKIDRNVQMLAQIFLWAQQMDHRLVPSPTFLFYSNKEKTIHIKFIFATAVFYELLIIAKICDQPLIVYETFALIAKFTNYLQNSYVWSQILTEQKCSIFAPDFAINGGIFRSIFAQVLRSMETSHTQLAVDRRFSIAVIDLD